MARRGRGRGKIKEPRIPTKQAAPVKQAPIQQAAPVASFVMPGTTPDITGIDLSNVQAPIPQLQQQTAPPPPELAPAVAQAPVPVPQIDPAVLAQIQQQFNIPTPAPQPAPVPVPQPVPAPAPTPLPEPIPPVKPMPGESGPITPNPGIPPVAPPPPPVEVAPPPPPVEPPIQVPPPVFQPEPVPMPIEPPVPNVPTPMAPPPAPEIVQPAPPPPAAVAPPPPPVSPGPIGLPAGFEIPEDILSRGTVGPITPPVQVPPPVMQPEPVAPPVQVPPPSFVDEFEEPLAMDGMRGGPRSGIGSLPEAPPEAVVPPPVQVPPTVVQPEAPTNQRLTSEELVNQYNTSPASQDFGTTVSYDPATNTFVEDVSSFGFTGDQATNTYTPEEFINRMGYESANTSFTPPPEGLVNEYNSSPAAQDFGVSVSYDPDTNTYVEDVSSFGFTGDQATNTYTPDEFTDRMGYGDPQPSVQPLTPEIPPEPETFTPPPVDPSLYSDPDLGVEPGFGGTRGEGFNPAGPRGAAGLNQGPRPDLSGPSGAAGMGGEDVTGIETMAPDVGFGDYINSEVNEAGVPAGAQPGLSDTISLPDGSTFDLTNLDLSEFNIGDFGSFGSVDPSLYSDPNLGGSQVPPPGQYTAGQGINEDGPGRGGFDAGGFEPGFGLPVDDTVGTNPNPNATFTPESVDLSGLDLSGLNINLGEGFDASGFEPDFTFGGNNNFDFAGIGPDDLGIGGPQGGPGMGNGPGNNMGNQGGDPYNPTVNDTDNPYPFIPGGIDTSQMTPDQLAGLNTFYENGGVEGLNINIGGIPGFTGGPINTGGGYTPGSGTGDGNYTVTPVDPVGDLDNTGGGDPVDVTTPYVPPNVRSASSYGLTGSTQTMPVAPNPFARPETQQGLGSLAGGG